MLLEIYKKACDVAKYVTNAVGGPLKSICESGRVIRAVPGLEEFANNKICELNTEIDKLIQAYRYGEVSDEETRAFAVSIENAKPYLFTFILHPGMPGHSNDGELLIKRCIVLPRKTQVALPDWTAAKNQANLQTIHANAAIWGVFPGEIVSANRGSWKPPPTKTLMSPPLQRPRPRVTPLCIGTSSDPTIQSTYISHGQNVKVAAA